MSIESATDAAPTTPAGLFDWINAIGGRDLHTAPGKITYAETPSDLFLAMTVAAILGALLAYHPKRKGDPFGNVSAGEVKKTQILICVAGAILFPLIRGDLALAFGLAGLGGFVRYRTALSNPLDLSMIFILIGLGMACGLQHYSVAISITAFIYLLLFVMDIPNGSNQYRWEIRVTSSDPQIVQKTFLGILKTKRDVHIERKRTNAEKGRFRCRFVTNHPLDTDEMTKDLKEKLKDGVEVVNIDWAKV